MSPPIELHAVSVDDRQGCTWALHRFSLVVDAGLTVAVVGPPDDRCGDAIADLLTGVRLPVEGRARVFGRDVATAGTCPGRSLVREERDLDRGERRVHVGGATLVAHPTPATLITADLLVLMDHGAEQARGRPIDLVSRSRAASVAAC